MFPRHRVNSVVLVEGKGRFGRTTTAEPQIQCTVLRWSVHELSGGKERIGYIQRSISMGLNSRVLVCWCLDAFFFFFSSERRKHEAGRDLI